jgi:hypothetical protein
MGPIISRSLRIGILSLSSLAMATLIARAESAPQVIELEWISPQDCRTAPLVQSTVARMVKNAPAFPQQVRVVISRVRNSWIADLVLRLGTRRLEGTSCEELTETLAVVIALAVEQSNAQPIPEGSSAAPQPESPTAAPAALPSSTAPDADAGAQTQSNREAGSESSAPLPGKNVPPEQAARESKPARQPRASVLAPPPTKIEVAEARDAAPPLVRRRHPRWNSLRLGALAGALGEVGALPRFAVAGSVGLRFAGPTWAFRARWATFFSQAARIDGRRVGSIAFGVATLSPCVVLPIADVWEACASFEYGTLSGNGEGSLERRGIGSTAWYAVGTDIGWRLELLEHYFLQPRVGVTVPLFHPAFRIDDAVAHRVGFVSGRAELNFGFQN